MADILARHPDETNASGMRFLVEHMCFDLSKAERMLDYDPKFTGEQGLEDALKWCVDNGAF
jgi:nucleoside-diphosphate-sugar epimerase